MLMSSLTVLDGIYVVLAATALLVLRAVQTRLPRSTQGLLAWRLAVSFSMADAVLPWLSSQPAFLVAPLNVWMSALDFGLKLAVLVTGIRIMQHQVQQSWSLARAIVLDGVVDPTVDLAGWLTQQTASIDAAITRAFSACTPSTGCPVDDLAATYDRVRDVTPVTASNASVALVAGIMWGSKSGVQFSLSMIALKALPVLMLGGFTSIPGAIVGGLIIGMGEKLFEFFIGPLIGGATENWFAYVLALFFLVFRPQGLFGERIIERI